MEAKQGPRIADETDKLKAALQAAETSCKEKDKIIKELADAVRLKDRQLRYLRGKVYNQPYVGKDGKLYGLRKNS